MGVFPALWGILTGLYALSIGFRIIHHEPLGGATLAGVGAVLAVWLGLVDGHSRSLLGRSWWRAGFVTVVTAVAGVNGWLMAGAFRDGEPGVWIRCAANLCLVSGALLLWSRKPPRSEPGELPDTR